MTSTTEVKKALRKQIRAAKNAVPFCEKLSRAETLMAQVEKLEQFQNARTVLLSHGTGIHRPGKHRHDNSAGGGFRPRGQPDGAWPWLLRPAALHHTPCLQGGCGIRIPDGGAGAYRAFRHQDE